VTIGGHAFDASVHRHQGAAIVELEPVLDGASDRTDVLRRTLASIAAARGLRELVDTAAQRVRELTAFDRVMVYRFDESDHGEVIAEAKAPEFEPYLGLHYPASDIPRQARQLYLENWIRVIPDARYVPAPLLPALRPDTGAPLDLTYSVLRSVSPVHLEYLANMGVRASMSVSLVVHGRLWGLVSCVNHGGPRSMGARLRTACELVGRLLSMQLAALADREIASRRALREPILSKLADAMRGSEEVLGGLFEHERELLELTEAAGVATLAGGQVRVAGEAAPAEAIEAIAAWAEAKGNSGDVLATHALASEVPRAEAWKALASGVLTFSLPGRPPRRLFWFRPEAVATVDWGGDPKKAVDTTTGRLHPRRSFDLWREEVHLQSVPWSESAREAAADLRRRAVEIDLEKQVAREQKAIQLRDDLIAVVSHDLRTPLSVINVETALMKERARDDQGARLERLYASIERIHRSTSRMSGLIHDLLDLAKIEAGRFQITLRREPVEEMVEEASMLLRPLAEAKQIVLERQFTAPATVMADRDRIFQVVSNLIGNAIKFTPAGGRVLLQGSVEGAFAVVSVSDTGPGVPPDQMQHVFNRYWQAQNRQREGTGLGLYIAKGIVEVHGGRIWVEARPEGGATFKFTLPLA
jgi:light-regulated signal transduction histidine kinase (bacteriophytochrome)